MPYTKTQKQKIRRELLLSVDMHTGLPRRMWMKQLKDYGNAQGIEEFQHNLDIRLFYKVNDDLIWAFMNSLLPKGGTFSDLCVPFDFNYTDFINDMVWNAVEVVGRKIEVDYIPPKRTLRKNNA